MNLEQVAIARELRARERLLLDDLWTLLERLDAARDDLDALRTAITDLEGVFMLVVGGEYNAGKSSLVNALTGAEVMPEGVTPTTDRVTIVVHGDEAGERSEADGLVRRTYPAEPLRDLAIVDTPGTNAVITRHQLLTERFIPRADMVLFVTSADRPYTESERAFLALIAGWGKKVTVVVNKVDILEGGADVDKVLAFVAQHARDTLGVAPEVFPLSAKLAQQAQTDSDGALLERSGLPALERFIESQLVDEARLRLKLQSPLGVAGHLSSRYRTVVSERLELLAEDRRTLEEIERQQEQFERDMRRDFEGHLARIKTVLLEVERRGDQFFDDTVRMRNVFGLMNSDRISTAFEEQVIKDADKDVELQVGEMVDWFLSRNLQLWEDVMGFVNERRQDDERIIGDIGGRFQYDRQALIRSLRDRAEGVLEGYDEQAESARLADRLQASVVQSGLMSVGGIGLGAAVLAFISSAALDVTGVTLGLTIVGLGLLVLPRRRRQAKRELQTKMQELRDGLEETLSQQVDLELSRSKERLGGAIAPYTRFVRSELERLDALQDELAGLDDDLTQLRAEVEAAELS
jgi:small GTP-binding protein